MPHSTQGSFDSDRTFDLGADESPVAPSPVISHRTVKAGTAKRQSEVYGIAISSPPPIQKAPPPQKAMASAVQTRSATSEMKTRRRISTPGTAEESSIASDILAQRGALNELVSQRSASRNSTYTDTSRRKSGHYDAQDVTTAQTKDRAQRHTPVFAELKTNVIIKDEFTLVTDLTSQLAQRYSRPNSCIMVQVSHSACLAMGSTFDPCYNLTINSVTSQMGPTMNKRNAALIQGFMADILSVPAERGIIKFSSIPEENLAIGGTTVQADTEKAEKERGRTKTTGDNGNRRSMIVEKKSSMPLLNGDVNGDGSVAKNGEEVLADRPRTAHGTSAAVNGLRMNPISPAELRSTNFARINNARPKSVGAPVRSSTAPLLKPEPIPNVSRQSSSQILPAAARVDTTTTTATKPKSALKATSIDTPLAPRPVKLSSNNTLITASIAPGPRSPTSSIARTASPLPQEPLKAAKKQSTHLDPLTALPAATTRSQASASTSDLHSTTTSSRAASDKADSVMAPSSSAVGPGHANPANTNGNGNGNVNASANTAKRRSQTLTSAVKIPQIPPEPPHSVAGSARGDEKDETRSMGSRLSKRKSFMRIFKRESKVEPWYKQ